MIKATLGEILKGKIDPTNHHVYLVKDNETVFYVGQSQNVVKRIRQHKSFFLHSALGLFMKMNKEIIAEWQVELFTIDELIPLIQAMRERRVQHQINLMRDTSLDISYYQTIGCRRELDAPPTLDEAEGAMIIKHSPCFNVDWNYQNPSPIPDRYNTRLVIRHKYPYPFDVPEKFMQQFTLIRLPLKSSVEPNEHKGDGYKPIYATQLSMFHNW